MTSEQITLRIEGHQIEGGYIYFTSPDVSGFRFVAEPNEIDPENSATLEHIFGVLMECYDRHRAFEESQKTRPI